VEHPLAQEPDPDAVDGDDRRGQRDEDECAAGHDVEPAAALRVDFR